jgi:hypothetical protein
MDILSNDDLILIRDILLEAYNPEELLDVDYQILNIIDLIEKELGVE